MGPGIDCGATEGYSEAMKSNEMYPLDLGFFRTFDLLVLPMSSFWNVNVCHMLSLHCVLEINNVSQVIDLNDLDDEISILRWEHVGKFFLT